MGLRDQTLELVCADRTRRGCWCRARRLNVRWRFHLDDRTDRHGVHLETFDPQPLLRLLLDWATDRLVLADLRVLPGSLEQAFLDVARQPVRGGGPALVETEVAA